jgi:hypothetical protein
MESYVFVYISIYTSLRARESATLRSKNTYQYLFFLLMVEFVIIHYISNEGPVRI